MLRQAAESEQIDVKGTLWLIEEMIKEGENYFASCQSRSAPDARQRAEIALGYCRTKVECT
jgi:hypothetical protein